MTGRALTAKEKAFVESYLVDLNATQAAVAAGYKLKTARQGGHQVLKRPHVAAAIQAAMDARAKRVEVTADTVLRELLLIARADIGQAFNADGSLRPIHEIPEETRRAIASIDTETRRDVTDETAGDADEITTRKLRFWDKLGALDKLGRHLKLFTDKIEVDVTDSLAERMAKAIARVKGTT